MPLHMTWADAAETAFGLSPELWHTAVSVFEIIKQNKIKEPSQARGRTIESIRNRLITHSRKSSGRFLWDQTNHKFALKSKVEKEKKKAAKRRASTAVDSTEHTEGGDSSSSCTKPKRCKSVPSLSLDLPSSPISSPLGLALTPATPQFEGVTRHKVFSCHDNMVYFEPIPLATVCEGPAPSCCVTEVEVDVEMEGQGGRGKERHCVAPPPTKLLNSRRRHYVARETSRQRGSPSWPPIQFNCDFFPELAFHYPSVSHSASNSTDVYCLIDGTNSAAGLGAGLEVGAHVVVVSTPHLASRPCSEASGEEEEEAGESSSRSVDPTSDTSDSSASAQLWSPRSNKNRSLPNRRLLSSRTGQKRAASQSSSDLPNHLASLPVPTSTSTTTSSSSSSNKVQPSLSSPGGKTQRSLSASSGKVQRSLSTPAVKAQPSVSSSSSKGASVLPSASASKALSKKVPEKKGSQNLLPSKSQKPVKSRKPLPHRRRASAPLSQREVHHLLTSPESALSRTNLRTLLTMDSYEQLSPEQKRNIAQCLPSMDQEKDQTGSVTATSSAFSNVFFSASLREWQRSLGNSEFTIEYQTRVRAEERRRVIEAAARSNTPTPRLIFPPKPCHVPVPREILLSEGEQGVLNVVTDCLQQLAPSPEPEPEPTVSALSPRSGTNTPTSSASASKAPSRASKPSSPGRKNAPALARPKVVSARGSRSNKSPVGGVRRKGSASPATPPSGESQLPSRGRPKKQPSTPPNGIVAKAVAVKKSSHTQLLPMATSSSSSPFKPPKASQTAALHPTLLSVLPSQMRYSEILLALERAHKDNMANCGGRGAGTSGGDQQRRRPSHEHPKRMVSRHMKHRTVPVYHDHFSLLSPTAQPDDFKWDSPPSFTPASAAPSVQPLPPTASTTAAVLREHHHNRPSSLPSLSAQPPPGPPGALGCDCGGRALRLCKNCMFVTCTSSSVQPCLVCGSKFFV